MSLVSKPKISKKKISGGAFEKSIVKKITQQGVGGDEDVVHIITALSEAEAKEFIKMARWYSNMWFIIPNHKYINKVLIENTRIQDFVNSKVDKKDIPKFLHNDIDTLQKYIKNFVSGLEPQLAIANTQVNNEKNDKSNKDRIEIDIVYTHTWRESDFKMFVPFTDLKEIVNNTKYTDKFLQEICKYLELNNLVDKNNNISATVYSNIFEISTDGIVTDNSPPLLKALDAVSKITHTRPPIAEGGRKKTTSTTKKTVKK